MQLYSEYTFFYSVVLVNIFIHLVYSVALRLNMYSLDQQQLDKYFPGRHVAVFGALTKLLQVPYLLGVMSDEIFFITICVDLLFYLALSLDFGVSCLLIKKSLFRKFAEYYALPVLFILFLFTDHLTGGYYLDNYRNVLKITVVVIFGLQLARYVIYTVKAFLKNEVLFKMYDSDYKWYKESLFRNVAVVYVNAGILLVSFLLVNRGFKAFIDIHAIAMILYVMTYWTKRQFVKNNRKYIHDAMMIEKITIPLTVDVGITHIPHPVPEKYIPNLHADNKLLRDICKIIEENQLYRNSNLKLQDLLLYLNTNRTYLSAAINKNNMNFYRLILCYRIRCIQELLQNNPGIKINEVAVDAGFSSPKNLSRIFRLELDLTPSEFKRLSKEEQDALLQRKKLKLECFYN